MGAIALAAIVIVLMAVLAPTTLMKIVQKFTDILTTSTHMKPLGASLPASLEGYRTQIFAVLAVIATVIRVSNVLSQEQFDILRQVKANPRRYTISLSDRFLSKMSGTTKSGNYFQKVADTLRHFGTVPEQVWPYDRTSFDWNDYYAEIPDWVKREAVRFLDLFDIRYEWVFVTKENLEKHLKHAPLQIGAATRSGWSNQSPVPTCDAQANHATLLTRAVKGRHYEILDHYEPFRKRLS